MLTNAALSLLALARPCAQRLAPAAGTRLYSKDGSKKSSLAEPSYFYASPGSSLREPLYLSLSDPVYFYDAGKSSRSDSVPPPSSGVAAAAPSASASAQHAPQPAAQPQDTSRPASKLPLAALMGSPAAPQADSRPHSYKLVDDMANQPYVISARNSMREPHYVSMSEPVYIPTEKK